MRGAKLGVFSLALLLFMSVFFPGCKNPATEIPSSVEGVAIPRISPAGGKHPDASLVITIACDTENALVFWTDDDTTPSAASNRYIEPFRIYGTSAKIKVIAILGDKSSAVAVASFTLNDGKTSSQLGIVKGWVRIPASTPEVAAQSINIFSDQLPGVVIHPDGTGFFFIDGLDTTRPYDFFFTNQEVGPILGSRRLAPRALGNGTVVAAQIQSVLAVAGAGLNLNDVQLKKTGRILGKALMFGRTGDALGDNTGIDVYVPGTSFAAKTAADGSFAIWYLPEGKYRLRAERSGYTFRETGGVTVLSEKDTDLSAEPLTIYYGYGTVTGQAALSDGSTDPISSEGITVLLRNLNDATSTFNTTTGPDGSYTLSNVEPGSYTALFSKTGYLSRSVDAIAVTGAKTTKVAGISLPALGGRIAGRAMVRGESDMSGTIVVARNESNGKTFSTGTGIDGSYSLDPILPGSYTLTASRVGFSTRTIAGLALTMGGALAPVDFLEMIPATGTVTGKVFLEGAADFSGVSATIRKSDDSTLSLSATSDSQGTYIFTGLKPGSYFVMFAKEGFLSGDGVTVDLVSDGVQNAPNASLKTSKARLAGNATLESASDHAGIAILATGDNGKTYSTLSDAVGRWVLSGMEAGTYSTQATKDGYTTARSDPILLGAGASVDSVSLRLAVSSRSIFGKVTLEGLSQHAGTKITATNLADITKIYSALTNNEGYYAIAGMLPGSYIVSYSKENYKGQTSSAVSLATTSTYAMPDIRLEQARGGIQGIVRLEGRASHSGIRVELVGTGYETRTAADGSYGLQVPSGNYPGGVRFEREDFETAMDTDTITVLTDSTFGVHTGNLRATHNSVSGIIDLLSSLDDSGIAVSIEGLGAFTTATGSGGAWRFDHVPIGSYTILFQRALTPTVSARILIGASEEVIVPKLDMIPNASGLKGYVKLTGMSDHSGIKLGVSTEGLGDLVATTNASGYFEIGNILSTGSHSITASKAGWGSWSTTISDFSPLEVRTIGVSPEIALSDSAPPLFDPLMGVVINAGANFTSDKVVTVALTANEQGSGIDKMQVQLNGFPASPNWEPYLPIFQRDMSSFLTYNGNGDYSFTIKLRDKARNISTAASDTITMTDTATTISGVLSAANLHWTKAKSPYRIEGNVLVESGKTLVIDPGVEVRFAGSYYIKLEGGIDAVGTADERIIFANAKDFTGSWQGFMMSETTPVTNVDKDWAYIGGNRFVYCVFSDAFYVFRGGIAPYFRYCQIDSNVSDPMSASRNGFFIDCNLIDYHNCSFKDCIINLGKGTLLRTPDNLINVVIRGTPQSFPINIQGYGGIYKNISFINISSPISLNTKLDCIRFENTGILDIGEYCSISNSEFINVTGIKTSVFKTANQASICLKYNDWGPAWTQELEAVGVNGNLSFVTDYYDDFNLVKLDLSGYVPAGALSGAGYGGDALVSVESAGVILDSRAYCHTKVLGASTGSRIRIGASYEEMKVATWSTYTDSLSLPVTVALTDVEKTIWAQVEDTAGHQSVPMRVACPVFRFIEVAGGSSDSIPGGTANGNWSVSSFTVGKTEVTQRQYAALMGRNPSMYGMGGTIGVDWMEHPVDTINWYDGIALANRLSQVTGMTPVYSYTGYGTDPANWPSDWSSTTHNNIIINPSANGYRLPTSAEWEWASRGGSSSLGYVYSGGNTVEDVAWISTDATSTREVGTKNPNELSISDMSGNVNEWCWDWAGAGMTGNNPTGAATGTNRILRGGSYSTDESTARVSSIVQDYPSNRQPNRGLRLVRSLP